jgi:hypothetical protein
MGEFKGIHDPAVLGVTTEAVGDSQPLFEPFDKLHEGGLIIMPDRTVAEIRHPFWHDDDRADDLAGRTSLLPLVAGETGVDWLGQNTDFSSGPTLGSESELSIMRNGEWLDLSPDGTHIMLPDNRCEKLADYGLDPEMLKYMLEYSTRPAHGYDEHTANMVHEAYRMEQWLIEHGLQTPEISLHTEDFLRKDTCQLEYIRKVEQKMLSLREFGCMSNQLHVQMSSPESGQHALNMYQGVQAIFGLATAAAPIRDGAFDTTIDRHYLQPWHLQQDPTDSFFDIGRLDSYDYLRRLGNVVPHDWRELARVLGSASAGTFVEPAPVSPDALLRLGDTRLRDGSIVTINRTLGMHTDRLRWDKGTLEICNLGTAGGNLYKKIATHEIIAKYLVAAQLHYETSPCSRDTWQEYYPQATERGHFNNIWAGLFGKGSPEFEASRLIDTTGRPATPRAMLCDLVDFTNEYSPELISFPAERELLATLAPEEPQMSTVAETFAAFFEHSSRMTATQALRHAHALEPGRPINSILEEFAEHRRTHVLKVAKENKIV